MAHIHTNWKDGTKTIRDEWGADDIQSVAENDSDLEEPLTPEQIARVMEIIVEGYDSNIGINWEVIGSAIDIMFMDEEIQDE